MQTAVQILDADRVRVTVEVPVTDIDHAFEHALRDLSRSARIPGFRRGKVPAGVLRTRLGPGAITSEALDSHLSSWYAQAMDLAQLEPVDRPSIDYGAPPTEGEPWVFTAEVRVAPEATLPLPLELRVERPAIDIQPDAVEERLQRMRGLAAEAEPVTDQAAESGMLAVIDFESSVNGRRFRDGSAKDYMVELGSGRLLAGLEEALVGLRPGASIDVEVPLPADAPDPKLRGRNAMFHLHLKELKRRVPPDLDDDFARSVSEFDTLADLRTDIERQLSERAGHEQEAAYRAAVLRALGEAAVVELPEALVARRLQERIRGLARVMARRGVPLEQFLQTTGQTLEEVAVELRPDVEASLRQERALRALADREQITIDDDELRQWVLEQAADEKDPATATRTVMESTASRETMRAELRLARALDRAVAQATPIDAATVPDSPAAAAPKPKIWLPGDPR